MQFFCFWVGLPECFKETFETVCIHGLDKRTGDSHGFKFHCTDDVDAGFRGGRRDGFIHAFFNLAVTYLGCHHRMYGIDEKNGGIRAGIGDQLPIRLDKPFLLR